MAWGSLEYTKEEYNMAGRVLTGAVRDEMGFDKSLEVINNFRFSHYHPLNTFQLRLRRNLSRVDGSAVVAQRIKRLYSIKHKLERFDTMRLSQMQDIGGCRAIVSTVDHLYKIFDVMRIKDKDRSGRGLKHKVIDIKDYVKEPKRSGYRGAHVVYSYVSDKAPEYNGLKIEIQLRTLLQHYWATAVETVGLFTGEALKSSMGGPDWLRFFSLASAGMSMHENTALVPGVPTSGDEIRKELRHYYSALSIESVLNGYKAVLNHVDFKEKGKGRNYYLIQMNNRQVTVHNYPVENLEKAMNDYLNLEKSALSDMGINSVLVSADSMANLKSAYPNYFIDTEMFLNSIKRIIK